ncbi:Dystrophin, isoforms A/C/F/G/H [Trachymyrmex septentrionalis]|uniref:Dystrophin, isoforms A/C/F/G/H n=1 Tax=Trachymyrmex septentrionalis TaxID=34720 RepID=A0A195EZG9_9HYME|nr:Dystrophin, isoforms A/C/F/G/H [Trachymyrmex septentrionalis]
MLLRSNNIAWYIIQCIIYCEMYIYRHIMIRRVVVATTNRSENRVRNVLRELEQKKPQLDELVHTAENLRADTNRQQLHGKEMHRIVKLPDIGYPDRM